MNYLQIISNIKLLIRNLIYSQLKMFNPLYKITKGLFHLWDLLILINNFYNKHLTMDNYFWHVFLYIFLKIWIEKYSYTMMVNLNITRYEKILIMDW
jgi:hypothetical protein